MRTRQSFKCLRCDGVFGPEKRRATVVGGHNVCWKCEFPFKKRMLEVVTDEYHAELAKEKKANKATIRRLEREYDARRREVDRV